jgi:enoyl-CoA hydratase
MTATEAARIGLINRAVRADELDVRVAQPASSMLDASVGYELLTNYADNHREAMAAFSNQRMPGFGRAS